MRRLPALLMGAVVLAAACWFAVVPRIHVASPAHWAAAAVRAAAGLDRLGPRSAWAQQTMQFRPVPPESVSLLERRSERHAAKPAAPAAPAAPDSLEPPEPPEPSAPVDVRSSSDMVRIGSNIHVLPGQTVHGDVTTLGGDVVVEGHVEGDVASTGGDVYLKTGARVDGDVACIGGQLHEAPGVMVGGRRVTMSGPRGIRYAIPFLGVMGASFKAVAALVNLLIVMALTWLVVKLAPARTRAALDTLRAEPGMSFGLGLLVWALLIPSVIALALVVALLCITIIGIPLAAAVGLAYCVFLLLLAIWGYVVGGAALGERLVRSLHRPDGSLLQAALWGVGCIGVLHAAGHLFGFLPLLGIMGGMVLAVAWVAQCVIGTMGMGALLRSEFGAGGYKRYAQWWPMRPAPGSGLGWAPGIVRPPEAADAAGTAPPPPPPPPAPSPPESYAPPPSGPATPGTDT